MWENNILLTNIVRLFSSEPWSLALPSLLGRRSRQRHLISPTRKPDVWGTHFNSSHDVRATRPSGLESPSQADLYVGAEESVWQLSFCMSRPQYIVEPQCASHNY